MRESTRSGQRICLFGGTFDPIHCAHLRLAEEATKRFRLDRVLFIPAAKPPHKPSGGLTPYEDRLRMVQIACAPYPSFEASRLEESEERSYTIDTVRRFKPSLQPGDQLYFLIGADAFDELESWKDWTELVQAIKFIVVTRPGVAYRTPEGATAFPLEGLELPISSSEIRAELAAGAATPELPEGVRAFIDARHLYRSEAGNSTTASPSRNTDRTHR
jgi:nicotinate-nucleotide adenylyltransferase